MATLATSSNASSGAGKPSGKQGRMTAPDLAFWKDCLHDYFAAKSGSVGKKDCRLKVSEILSVASLPAFTGNPQVAGTALKQDGRFHKFGKYWGLKIDGADDRSGRLYSGGYAPITNLSLKPRPQMPVPGFEETLTCCTDWPQTKKGEPPSAQSTVFMPLLAMVHGPIDGFCTEKQLGAAFKWWSLALPAFPSWVERMLKAGAKERLKDIFVKNVSGRPNSLIPKHKGHGKVPHIKGRIQTSILEMDMMVSIEIYQAVACMYSQKQFQ
jgi:hypothetical protein